MIVQPRIVPTVLLITFAACTSRSEHTPATDSAGAPRVGSASSAPGTSSAASPASDSTVTEHGLGPLRVGMTLAEARTALGGAFVVPVESDTMSCDYATWRGGPRGVHVMIDSGRVARVEVDSVGIATGAGARVGDSEERIRSLYPGRVTVTPHKYVEGHYLTVNATGDSSSAIVFETEKGRVTRYRAGRRPAVEYVEGCG